ncbi:MAG TPA: hypothetical protein DIT64_20270 [Verrucomicrobiales bacterium]|nr:hypothetical protein [Verrucomicrobiales bacterium]
MEDQAQSGFGNVISPDNASQPRWQIRAAMVVRDEIHTGQNHQSFGTLRQTVQAVRQHLQFPFNGIGVKRTFG